jgi:chromosome segregation ATPase
VRSLSTQNDSLTGYQTELLATQKRLEQSEIDVKNLQIQVELISQLNTNLTQEVAETQTARDRTAKEFEEIAKTVRQIHKLLRPANADQVDVSMELSGQFLKELSTLRDLLLGSHSDIESLVQQRTQLLEDVTELKRSALLRSRAEEETRTELATMKGNNQALEREVRSLSELTVGYNKERQKLSDAINRLRSALHLTKNSLTASEQEKQKLKEGAVQLKILLEHIIDVHHLSIVIPE